MDSVVKSNSISKVKPSWMRFKGVDVFRTYFGSVSEAAVFDVYSQTQGVSVSEAKRKTFHHCVETLRKIQNPDYILNVDREY